LRIRKRDSRGAVPVGDIIAGVLSRNGLSGLVEAGRVLAAWDGVVGAALTGHTKPVSFRDGVLTVFVDSAAWLFQVERFHKKLIMDKLNRTLGKPLVKRIVFRAGEVDRVSDSPRT